MLRTGLSLLLVLGLRAGSAAPQTPSMDADVTKGIRLVDEGDYDAAIVVLDAAARRLATDRARTRDLSQAYLYLGIAYVGKGHEAAAKAKFREAINQIKDLSLSVDRYPPKVIDLFEAAKDEANRAGAAPKAAATPPPKVESNGGGGGKKVLLIGGGLALVGGGVAVALSSKSSSDGSCDSFYEERSGLLNASGTTFSLTTTPTQAGSWKGEVTWTISGAPPEFPAPTVFLFAREAASGQDVAQFQQITTTNKKVEWQGLPGTQYRVGIELRDFVHGGTANYQLTVAGPCF